VSTETKVREIRRFCRANGDEARVGKYEEAKFRKTAFGAPAKEKKKRPLR